ncbi:myocyte-specific enhancer factor 2D isoform X3 [Pantherophis guttatus]|uniref:Myocyte-specific enhancer factor 2D isoform X3 n=1 Tax=Pantherophis guttatus TaxID=94885 RepID=A0A6P9CT77_PANGU|nr:myocyte-specific enhancer factor 2D isoform X3 [Pantherophis guttatus]
MGRKKIQIQRITDERNRQVTFTKRKFGLMKKAYELSVLCDCEIALIIFNHSNKLFQYASTDMDKVLLKYTEYNEPHESRTNADIIEALNKKHREGESPDGEDIFTLTPQTEEKYRKIDEEFDKMMQTYRLTSSVPAPNFAMPVTVPVTNQNALPFSSPGGSLVTPSLVTSSLTDPRLLSPQQPALQRNTVSPALPQRPASAGAMLGGELGNTNGACPSPVGNGYVSARASPNLLPVSNGNSLGKAVPAKSPPPPPQHSNPLATNIRKPDLRVITSQGGKGLLQHLTDDQLDLQNAQRLMVSQATHSLTTPVVSVATPSLLTQGLPFSAMPTAYNTDYQLSSAELSSLPAFSSPTSLSLGSLSAWQPQPQQLQQPQQIPVSLSNLIQGSHLPHTAATASISAATLTVNTSPSISIKSEPVSPSRERNSGTPLSLSSFPHQARHEPSGRSPVDSLSSNASSYEGPSEREDPSRADFGSSLGLLRPSAEAEGENPSIKRMRLDAWAT